MHAVIGHCVHLYFLHPFDASVRPYGASVRPYSAIRKITCPRVPSTWIICPS